MGDGGSGISLASYFGSRIGQQVLGLAEGRSPLDLTTFQTRPYYTGNPWYLAPTIHYYKWLDDRPPSDIRPAEPTTRIALTRHSM